jgi:hypothetical protein
MPFMGLCEADHYLPELRLAQPFGSQPAKDSAVFTGPPAVGAFRAPPPFACNNKDVSESPGAAAIQKRTQSRMGFVLSPAMEVEAGFYLLTSLRQTPGLSPVESGEGRRGEGKRAVGGADAGWRPGRTTCGF